MTRDKIYFLLLIPPLFYLHIGPFQNIGSYLSILGISFAALYISAFNFEIDLKKTILLSSVLFFIFYFGSNNSLIQTQGVGFVNGSYWWIFLFLVILFFKIPSFNDLIKISHGVSMVSIMVLSTDAIYRLVFNVVQRDDIGRYAFKKGLIDMDSNFAGIYALLIFFMSLYCARYSRKFIKYLPMLYGLVLTSLSFAAIAVTSIFLVFFLLPKKLQLFFTFCMIIFAPIILTFILDLMSADNSGLTKIRFVQEGFNIFINRDIYGVLFGTGVSSVSINGYEPHLLVLQLFLQYGIIGFSLYYFIQLVLILLFSKSYIYILLPFFIVSFSVSSISNPIVTVVILIFYYFSYYENEYNKLFIPNDTS